jgi:hypothetical protein
MAFEEDLSLFLDAEGGFAVQATATTRFGELVQFQIIFDDASEASLGGFVESTQPTALARSASVVDLRHGSPVDIGDVAYVVSGTQPDGTGMTRITLERAAS